jgi:hypothetical protein
VADPITIISAATGPLTLAFRIGQLQSLTVHLGCERWTIHDEANPLFYSPNGFFFREAHAFLWLINDVGTRSFSMSST